MNINRTRGLSPLEARVVLELEWEERRVVERREIIEFLDGDPNRADPVIRSLRRKGWLERISAGRYLLIPASRGPEGIPDGNFLPIAGHLAESYYIGYATAAAHHRLTDQARAAVWVVTPRTVRNRSIRGIRFHFVTLIERKFFGYEPVKVFGDEVMMSDPEKTVLDCVDRMPNAGGIGEVTKIIARALPSFNWKRFARHATRFGSIAVVQRFGYLAGQAKLDIPPAVRKRLRGHIKPRSRSYLGPTARWGSKATYNAEWQILVNVPQHEITSEL